MKSSGNVLETEKEQPGISNLQRDARRDSLYRHGTTGSASFTSTGTTYGAIKRRRRRQNKEHQIEILSSGGVSFVSPKASSRGLIKGPRRHGQAVSIVSGDTAGLYCVCGLVAHVLHSVFSASAPPVNTSVPL